MTKRSKTQFKWLARLKKDTSSSIVQTIKKMTKLMENSYIQNPIDTGNPRKEKNPLKPSKAWSNLLQQGNNSLLIL